MTQLTETIGLIGGGQMGEALIRGILDSGLIAKEKVFVVDPSTDRRDYLHRQYGITALADGTSLCQRCSVLVLAIKPQVLESVLEQYQAFVTANHLVISIMAGIQLGTIASCLDKNISIIRVMPNTPALVLAGASAFSANNNVTARDREIANAILSAAGTSVEVHEDMLDAVTGLSGSGPGYVFTFIEAMIDGGVLAGLPRPIAEQLVLQTVYGSAKLALDTGEPAAVLKGKVTSPGGTTITGIQQLEQSGFRGAVMDAVKAATERSKELGA